MKGLNILLAVLAVSMVAAFPLAGDVYAQTPPPTPEVVTAKIVNENIIDVKFNIPVSVRGDTVIEYMDFDGDTLTVGNGITRSVIGGDTLRVVVDRDHLGDERKFATGATTSLSITNLYGTGNTDLTYAYTETSLTISDGQAPKLVSSNITNGTTIVLKFSESVELDDTGDNPITDPTDLFGPPSFDNGIGGNVASASGTGSDTITILFTPSSSLPNTATGTINIKAGLVDSAGNEFKAGQIDLDAAQIPKVESVKVTATNTITVTFSETVSNLTRANFTNLVISGSGIDGTEAVNIRTVASDCDTCNLTVSGITLPHDAKGSIRIDSTSGATDADSNRVPSGNYTVTDGIAPILADNPVVNTEKKEIEITFSEPVKAKKDHFTYDDTTNEISRISGNGTATVTLYLKNDLDPNTTDLGNVTITSDVTDLADTNFADDATESVAAGQDPTLESVYHTGYAMADYDGDGENEPVTIITLTFSENVNFASTSDGVFVLTYRNQDIALVDGSVSGENTNMITFNVAAEIATRATASLEIKDGIQNSATSVPFKSTTAVVDASQLPKVVSAKITAPTTVTIEFSEAIQTVTSASIELKVSGEVVPLSGEPAPSDSSINTTWTLSTTEDLPTDATGTITFTSRTDPATDTTSLLDSDGNKLNGKTKNIEDVTDAQNPNFETARIVSGELIEVKFSEAVYANADNFTLTVDDDPKNISSIEGSGTDTILLTTSGSSMATTAEGELTLRVTPSDNTVDPTGLYDEAKNRLAAPPAADPPIDPDNSYVVLVSSAQIPTVVEDGAKITAPNTLSIQFDNPVRATVSSFTNFVVEFDDDDGITTSEDDRRLSNIQGSGTDTITLTISGNELPANAQGSITIGDSVISERSGASFVTETVDIVPGQPPMLLSAKLTSDSDISLKFSEKVNFTNDNFDVKINSKKSLFDDSGHGSDSVKLILTSGDELPDDATGTLTVTGVTNADTGVEIVKVNNFKIEDGQPPTVLDATIIDENYIMIEFSEDVSATLTDFDMFKVDGSDTAIDLTDIEGSGTDTIKLKVSGEPLPPDAVGVINISGSVTDLAEDPNSLVAVPEREVKAGQIPGVEDAVVSSPNTVTVTFTEAVIVDNNSFTNLVIAGQPRNATVTGSGTDTIVLTITGSDITKTDTGSVNISQNITDIVNNNLAEPLPDYTIDADPAPTIKSIEITGFNTISVMLSEPITTVRDDFTGFKVMDEDDNPTDINIVNVQGTGTDTITLVTSVPIPTDISSATINISPSDVEQTASDGTVPASNTYNSLVDRNEQLIIVDGYGFENNPAMVTTADETLEPPTATDYPVEDARGDAPVIVMGTISNADGTGIDGAVVDIGGMVITTDSDGMYEITGLVAGNYTASVFTPNDGADTKSVTIVSGDNTVDFMLGELPSIKGTILAGGNPVSGVTVSIPLSNLTTTTNDMGEYSFTGLADGDYTVYIPKPTDYDYVNNEYVKRVTVTEGQSAVADFTLQYTAVGSISGIVRDASDTVSGAMVTISTTPEQSVTTIVGTYGFSNIEPGSYTVTITADGYNTTTEDVTVGAREDVTLNITLVETIVSGSINGNVVDADTGAALSGVSVELSTTARVVDTTTTSVGFYSFSDVEAGEYTLTFTYSGYGAANRIVTVAAGETTTPSRVQLEPETSTGTVRGSVTDATTGSGIASATVTLSSVGTPTLTTASGSYSFSNIEPGTYTLSVTHDGYQVSTTSITVTVGSSTVTNLQLVPIVAGTTGTITGVVSSDGNPIAGAIVSLSGTGTTNVTNANGEYAFVNVPAGSYTVSVTADGYSRSTATGTVTANETSTTNVMLVAMPTNSIQGTVYSDSNGNDKIDPSEASNVHADVKVFLVTPTGTLEDMTDDNGMYMFDELEAGSYAVYIESPFTYEVVQVQDTHIVNLGL